MKKTTKLKLSIVIDYDVQLSDREIESTKRRLRSGADHLAREGFLEAFSGKRALNLWDTSVEEVANYADPDVVPIKDNAELEEVFRKTVKLFDDKEGHGMASGCAFLGENIKRIAHFWNTH